MSDTAATTPQVPGRRMPRWLWAVLIASLALNLLVVGSMAGFAWRHGGWGGGGGGHGFFFGGRLLRELPEDRRAEVKAILDTRSTAMWDAWKGVGDARAEAMRLFEAEPFDRAAFEAALERMNGKEIEARKAMYTMMGEIGQKLGPEERRRVLKHFRRGWWGRRHGRGAEGEGP